jgi:hypothetical protein
MSNGIILFQIYYGHLECQLFSIMKVKIIKFIQCGPCSINGPKFSKFSLFETFYITIAHLVFNKFINFKYIDTLYVCDRNLGPQKKIHTFFMILNFFFLKDKVLDFFPRLGRILETYSNLTCYA